MLLSSLCFARDIEQCNGFEKEFINIDKQRLNIINKSNILNIKLEDRTLSKYDVNDFLLYASEVEDLADHIMYYHAEEMNSENLTYIRKIKIILKKYKDVMTELKIRLDYNL